MKQKTQTTYLPILPILGVIFITLKLCGVIAWSWWWVLAPFWMVPLAVMAFFGVVAIFVLISDKIGETK